MVSGKTHDVGAEHGNQADKPTPEANRHEPEGKVCFLEKKQAEKHMTCVFKEESKRKTQNREDKKRMRYENKERYI